MNNKLKHNPVAGLSKLPVISVIVPIYNTEKYLEKCLNSLQSQTLENIEIIMIDDGSTDGCGVICDKYAEHDARFKVIHRNHGGPSVARNEGLDIAQAQYLMFVNIITLGSTPSHA